MVMKNTFFIVLFSIFIILSGCNNGTQVSQEEALGKAVKYYPEDVSFQYVRQDKITDESNRDGFVDQDCYIFDVIYNEKHISRVAVGVEDASIWFLDMNDGNLWLSESFMGLPKNNNTEAVPREPVIDTSHENNGTVNLYFANLDTIPELSDRNEGGALWDEKEKSLRISAVKVTGSVTGAPDGPSFTVIVSWADGEPVVESIEYQPAPTYSQPGQVLLSGETMSIETDRLIEIAEYFRGLIDDKSTS